MYGKENYSMTSGDSFFQTQFANSQLVTCPLHFLTLKRYISESIGWSALVFWNLYGKVAIDQVPKLRRKKIIR